jgi:hypothetical protein
MWSTGWKRPEEKEELTRVKRRGDFRNAFFRGSPEGS